MFDKMLSAALTYFGESKVDYMVLETGSNIAHVAYVIHNIVAIHMASKIIMF